LETGLRADYVIDYGAVFLPRVSALFKIANGLTSRVGGGFGYKTPTIFTEEIERIQYRKAMPIDDEINKLEKSYGANADINYRTNIGEDWTFSINQLFFILIWIILCCFKMHCQIFISSSIHRVTSIQKGPKQT